MDLGPLHDPIRFQRRAPTISLPGGLNSEGLPLSIQFVGKRLAEPLLVQIGDAYESATRHDLRPAI